MTQSRRMLVLRAVVEDYIRSQEPVGSTTLTKDHDLGVSSATVRNDMAALEDEGYLIQPHTSAGRIPTEKGYRYFVDRLATVVPMSEAQRRGINSFLSGSVNLQDTLQRAARLLAQITGQVAVVAAPSLAKSTLRHIEIVPVSINTLLAVVITDTGRVAQHILNVSELPDTTVLSHLVNEINAQCASVSLTRTADYVRQMSSRKEYRPISTTGGNACSSFRWHGRRRARERTLYGRNLTTRAPACRGRSCTIVRCAGRASRAHETHEHVERNHAIRWSRSGHRLRNAHARSAACIRGDQRVRSNLGNR